ncbi:acylneuraminate cytidylyltransferase family protein [Ornithobacterium rhinotracheale]|uniref:acylneuraminate cytidylyltransferase family protein n=1 Tax=Ornithobacterium rhinotracheale TaxID=28251 RepID=UPI00403A54B6
MKNIVIIPARGGSKRLPEKNIKELGGKPLLTHSIDYAKSFDFIDDIIVSTDCDKIKEVATQAGAKVIDRPEELSGDFVPTVAALQHVAEALNLGDNDNIILLQATNPLRPKNLLKEAMEIYTQNNYKSLFTVSRDAHKLGKIKNHKFIPFNYEFGMRSQDMEPLYYENGLLYITKKHLINKGIIMNEESYPLFVEGHLGNIDIDDQYDFDFAEFVLSKLL